MKNSMKYIGMAALALVGAIFMGCSENDLAENSPKGKAVTLTTTISLDGSSVATRALDADGKKTFAKGEQIALIYQDANDGVQKVVSAELKETDILSDGKKATLTFSLDKAAKAGGDFAMIYPASMAIESIPDGGEFGDCAAPNYTALTTQDGTLASLSTKLDLAKCESTFTTDATLPNGITLANDLAILELSSITDYAGNDLTSKITELRITVMGSSTYYVSRTAAAGPIYIATNPCSDNAISFSTTINGTTYAKTVPSKTLAASTMTPVKLKLQKLVNLNNLTSDYTAQDGDFLYNSINNNVKISIAAGATVELECATISVHATDGNARAGITCLGDATIILKKTNKVQTSSEGYPGIQAAYNGSDAEYTLTIQGDGELEAIGGKYGAGIGSGNGGYCGNIKIEGGNITATGGDGAAGIGSGYQGKCGNIKIEGGTITATGGQSAAGIGSGRSTNDYSSSCGNISISGNASITATGGENAAGIGSGRGFPNSNLSVCGTITISGNASIKATGGNNGAGIGSALTSTCGAITISGGTIEEAKGGQYGAGIGSAGGPSSTKSECGNITISGGIIKKATGGQNAAGIGSGYSLSSVKSKCGNITISGGNIELAKGSSAAAGIGNGNHGICGDITITTKVSQVTAIKSSSVDNQNTSIGLGSNDSTCGKIIFGTATVYSGDDTSTTPPTSGAWTPATMVAGEYGGLTLAISTTTEANDTWTLTPTSN